MSLLFTFELMTCIIGLRLRRMTQLDLILLFSVIVMLILFGVKAELNFERKLFREVEGSTLTAG